MSKDPKMKGGLSPLGATQRLLQKQRQVLKGPLEHLYNRGPVDTDDEADVQKHNPGPKDTPTEGEESNDSLFSTTPSLRPKGPMSK